MIGEAHSIIGFARMLDRHLEWYMAGIERVPPEEMERQASHVLDDLHHRLCDDASNHQIEIVKEVIASFRACGMITAEQARLRELALASCPGHRGGGRDWCAYCGTLQPEEGK